MPSYEAASQEDLHCLGGSDGSVPWGMLSKEEVLQPHTAPAVSPSIHGKAVGSIWAGFMSFWVSTRNGSALTTSTVHGEKRAVPEQFACSAVDIECKAG